MVTQDTFLNCYRGKQSVLRHAAYMRMGKVLLLQHLLAKHRIELSHRSVFDYGFGAGTFFRYCPTSARLFGVELDPVCVDEVGRTLSERGFQDVSLYPLDILTWETHPLLSQKYDVIVSSHVLEHLPTPRIFLTRMAGCLEPAGVFLGLVPINERRQDPHHAWRITRPMFGDWLEDSSLRLVDWVEADPWLYWLQPLFTYESRAVHKFAQLISFALGVAATAAGYRTWFKLASIFSRVSFSKPTQAGFILQRGQ